MGPSLTVFFRWVLVLLPIAFLFGQAVAQTCVVAIAVGFLLRGIALREYSWMRDRWVMVLLLLWVWLCVAGLVADPMREALNRGAVFIRYPLFVAAVLFWLGNDVRTQRLVGWSLLIAVAFLAGDMLWQYVSGFDVFGNPADRFAEFTRLSGPYKSPHAGISLLWIGFPALFLLYGMANRWARAASVLLSIGFALAIYYSGERMAFLLMLCGFCLALVLMLLRRRWFAAFAIVVSLGIVAAAIQQDLKPTPPVTSAVADASSSAVTAPATAPSSSYVLDAQPTRICEGIKNFWDSIYGKLWLSGWHVGLSKPLTGVGLRNFRYACADVEDPTPVTERCGAHPHNLYMELFAEAGAVGMGLFILAMAMLLWRAWRARHAVLADTVTAGLLVTLLVRLWPLATTTGQFHPWSADPFWFIVALLAVRLSMQHSDARAA